LWTLRWHVGLASAGLAGHNDIPDELPRDADDDIDALPRTTTDGSQNGSQANRRRWTAMDPLSVTWKPGTPWLSVVPVLVMRRSRVRIPKAAPPSSQVRRYFFLTHQSVQMTVAANVAAKKLAEKG